VEKEVMQWLDAQEQSTVLYVSFGSLLTVTEVQIHELAYGLETSGRPFLWVYRAPSAPQVLPADAADGALLLDGLPAGALHIQDPSWWDINMDSNIIASTITRLLTSE